jgi:hypothetical protein
LNHKPAISSHCGEAPVSGAVRMVQDQGAGAVVWLVFGSRSFLRHFVQERLPLFSGQELEEP